MSVAVSRSPCRRPWYEVRSVFYAALAVLSVAGVALVLWGTCRYGVGISPDSAGYLCAARSLLAGRGLWTLCYTHYSAWPPLFPTVLAALGLTGIDPADGARFLNAAAMGGIVFTSGLFFRSCLRSRWLVWIGVCSVVLSFPLVGISSMAWTEPLFLLLILAFILQMSVFLRDRRVTPLLVAAVLAALCSMQRYTGVTLIGAGVLLILWPGANCPPGRRLKHLACFVMISSAPLGLWMARNYRLTSMFTGHGRQPSIYSLGENLVTAADTATRWFMPEQISLPVRAGVVGGLIVLTLAALFVLRAKVGLVPGGDRGRVWTAGLVAMVYIPLILYTHQVGVLDEPMNDRYLVPLVAISLWMAFAAVDELVALLKRCPAPGSMAASAMILLCGLWLIHPAKHTRKILAYQMTGGAGGFSQVEWRESPLAQWLHAHPPQGVLRSNAPDALYALTAVDAHVSPHRVWDVPGFLQTISSGAGETLIWFGGAPRIYLYDLDELIAMLPLREIVSLPDGGVYRLGISPESGSFNPRILSTYLVDGARNRRFTSDTLGCRGRISSWVLREDGTTDSVWEWSTPDGKVITWSPSCGYSRSGDTFQFDCEGQAARAPDGSVAPYKLHVQGTIRGDVAEGEYRIEFPGEQWLAADKGRWRVDIAAQLRRLYSPERGIHAYTMSREEAAAMPKRVGESWVRECVALCAYAEGTQPPDASPVFRFTSKATGADFYTISEAERDAVLGNSRAWDYKGVAWYAYSSERHPPGARPVYRFWSGTCSTHFYTMDESEKETLLKSPAETWAYEGIVWYALPPERP